jgi:hypothetical protein
VPYIAFIWLESDWNACDTRNFEHQVSDFECPYLIILYHPSHREPYPSHFPADDKALLSRFLLMSLRSHISLAQVALLG